MTQSQSLRVALVWKGTIIQERTFTRTSNPAVAVGGDGHDVFIAPAHGIPEAFEMFERRGGEYFLRWTHNLQGDLHLQDNEVALADLTDDATPIDSVVTDAGDTTVYETVLHPGDWGLIELSEHTQLFYQLIDDMPAAPQRGLFGAVTGLTAVLAGFLAISGVLHASFLLAAFLNYEPQADLNPMLYENRFLTVMAEDPSEPLEEPEEQAPAEQAEGKRSGGEEGKVGEEDAEVQETKLADVDGELVEDAKDMSKVGVNDALRTSLVGGGALKSVFGDSEGFNAKMKVAMEGQGNEVVLGRGEGGMGLRGLDDGGGGPDGIGRIGAIGKVDTGGGLGRGGEVKKKKKEAVEHTFTRGTPKVGDFCDKNDIRRVIRAKSSAIKYCFEKELQANSSLSGKIVAQWRVGLDGKVMAPSIASSTMDNDKVEGCITRVIARMRFQKPAGGICVINYPFVFSGLE